VATPTSYLQTLSSAEASAFVTSLQKVQAHLQQELAWMDHQIQQKTMQLQGIETLLAEALTLSHLETDAGMSATPDASDVKTAQTTKASAPAPAAAEAVAPTEAKPSGANGTGAIADASEQVSTQASASPPAPVAATSETAQSEKTAPKPSAKAKSQKSSSAKATTKKKPAAKTQSRSKASKAQAQPKSRALLRPEFADETLTDAVTQVLTQAGEPTHIDQLVSELYENVSGEDLKRIKGALANVLSKGKRSGKWRNVGNGVYQIKT
jgi:hypothetical protein